MKAAIALSILGSALVSGIASAWYYNPEGVYRNTQLCKSGEMEACKQLVARENRMTNENFSDYSPKDFNDAALLKHYQLNNIK